MFFCGVFFCSSAIVKQYFVVDSAKIGTLLIVILLSINTKHYLCSWEQVPI
nr:MAG TPA: hypothetical protein [Caudoviricetes sp.]DAY23882.1 MAG TPA: hypothetical protein [Caudoviricetes sp.]